MSSIIRSKKLIEEGDLVIIYVNFKQTYALIVERGNTFQTRFGALRHDRLIGQSFGSKVDCTKGYVYVLCPTPELYTQNLSHRTQILYAHDISLITVMLDLKPGSVLAEAGTGSGSFTHAAARTVTPNGTVFTFEVDVERFQLASSDFKRHGLGDSVKIGHRDVCAEGLGLSNVVDAVFLDLPRPWEVVESAKQAMKPNSLCRFASFSPCIEQVQRTCDKLRETNFIQVEVVECIPRAMKVMRVDFQPDYSIPCSPRGGSALSEPPAKMAKTNRTEDQCSDEDEENAEERKEGSETSYLSCVAFPAEQPTHTGYLTFATLLPRMSRILIE